MTNKRGNLFPELLRGIFFALCFFAFMLTGRVGSYVPYNNTTMYFARSGRERSWIWVQSNIE